MMIPIGMGAAATPTTAPLQVVAPSPTYPTAPSTIDMGAATPAPQPIDSATLGSYVALIAAAAAQGAPTMDAPTVTTYCGYCADPVTALTNFLAQKNVTLATGLTPASVIQTYQTDIAGVCGDIAARAQQLGVTTPCTPPGASSGGSGSPLCLFGDTSPQIASSIPVCRNTALGVLAAAAIALFMIGGRK
jgi:hypothetical protein